MTTTPEIQTQHSELGPSASERWLNCPGSVQLIRPLEKTSSIYAAEGNAAHLLSEWARQNSVPVETYRDEVIRIDGYEFTVDSEFIDNVQEFVDYCDALPGYPLYEAMVEYEPWVPGGFGTLDDGRLNDGVCYVTDLKYGKGVRVGAAGNSQFLLYALGLYNGYGHLYDFDRFVLTVHQPRLEHVETVEIGLDDLLQWADKKVRPIAAAALAGGAELKAGDHCFFCPARRAGCRVYDEYVRQGVFEEFENLDAGVKDVDFMTNDELALALPYVPVVKKWCTDLPARARSEIARGGRVCHPETGDYKMVEGRSNRAWRDPVAALSALELEFGPNKDFINAKGEIMSPAAIEKIVGKKALAALDLVTKPPGAPVLVEGTDPRESLELKAENEFDDLENEE